MTEIVAGAVAVFRRLNSHVSARTLSSKSDYRMSVTFP